MAISWSGAVALANKIASDVPAIKTMLDALAKMDFTGITGIPANVKRIASVTGGVQIQKYASNAWATVGKLMHDVDTVDGKHAATGTTANTIPVRDASGKLPGGITGNAATASKASALADGYEGRHGRDPGGGRPRQPRRGQRGQYHQGHAFNGARRHWTHGRVRHRRRHRRFRHQGQ